jgi:ABC-type transporter Mla MlaB component
METSGRQTVAFAIRGPIRRADLPGLCDRVCAVLAGAGGVVCCDVEGVEPDAVVVDALARLQLAARRSGCAVVLECASPELLQLVRLMGLDHVLPPTEVSRTPDRAMNGTWPTTR